MVIRKNVIKSFVLITLEKGRDERVAAELENALAMIGIFLHGVLDEVSRMKVGNCV